jgi:hypothetical protein
LRHFYAASTGEAIQFGNALCCGVRHGVSFPFSVGRLIATCKGKIALLKPGIRQKRRSCGGTAGISTSFFASQNKQLQKNIEIPKSHLLQFPARAIHCPCREKVRS